MQLPQVTWSAGMNVKSHVKCNFVKCIIYIKENDWLLVFYFPNSNLPGQIYRHIHTHRVKLWFLWQLCWVDLSYHFWREHNKMTIVRFEHGFHGQSTNILTMRPFMTNSVCKMDKLYMLDPSLTHDILLLLPG